MLVYQNVHRSLEWPVRKSGTERRKCSFTDSVRSEKLSLCSSTTCDCGYLSLPVNHDQQ